MPIVPDTLELYRTAIPMKAFDHAAASRETAAAVVAGIRYSDGVVSWGETLPREYVTGETLETVPDDIAALWDRCVAEDILSETADVREIPTVHDGRCVNAAAAALDIAATRRYMTLSGALRTCAAQQLLGREADLAKRIVSRVSGVLGSRDPDKNARRLRLMRLAGLKDFKLKVGFDESIDRENLRRIHYQLRKGLGKGTYTLRVDANGAWDRKTTLDRMDWLLRHDVCAVEQPVYCTAGELGALSRGCALPLIADESLLTLDDAHVLLETAGDRVWWNVRISKNGGILPALKLLQLAEASGITAVLGCMVGESAILSAAQRRLLQMAPPPRFVEGNYGRLLLADDLLEGRRSLRFGWGGRLKPLKDTTLGIEVDPEKIEQYGTPLLTRGA